MSNFRCPNDDKVFFTESKDAPRIGVAHPDCDGPFCRAELESAEKARADAAAVITDPGLKPLTPILPMEITEHHVKFLQFKGYQVQTVEDAQKFFDNIPPDLRPGFLEDAAAWKEAQ